MNNEDVGYWYFTFTQGQGILRNKYVKIKGNFWEARKLMQAAHGSTWATQYSEKDFEVQKEKYELVELAS